MPIDPSVHTRVSTEDSVNRQCQHCFKAQTVELTLKSCSRCKRAHYCSKECQTADWPQHKKRCKHNVETMAKMKAEVASGGMDAVKARIAADLKRWQQAHRPPLTEAAFHALRLQLHPENCTRKALYVKLERSGRPVPYHFNVVDTFAITKDDLYASSQDGPENMARLAAAEEIWHRSDQLREQGALGVAVALVASGTVWRVIPLGIADGGPRVAHRSEWAETFSAVVEGRMKL